MNFVPSKVPSNEETHSYGSALSRCSTYSRGGTRTRDPGIMSSISAPAKKVSFE
jgi:hypothetical protein